jgi:hypothetical protein
MATLAQDKTRQGKTTTLLRTAQCTCQQQQGGSVKVKIIGRTEALQRSRLEAVGDVFLDHLFIRRRRNTRMPQVQCTFPVAEQQQGGSAKRL